MKKRNDKIIKRGKNLMRLLALAFAFGAILSVNAAAVFETLNNATDEAKVFTFGSPVEAGEIQTNNIGSASSCADGRFAFRAGTVNVREGGYVRANGNGTASADKLLGNWLGANAGIATLNIEGGTFWMDVSGASNDGAGVLRVPVNGGSNDAILNLCSGVLRVDKYLHIGGTQYNSIAACAKNGVVNISGGTAEIATLNLGASSTKGGSASKGGYANATLNLTGGTLEVAKFNFTAGHSQFFTWGSGTVKATAANVFSSATLASGCARMVNVTGNPAVFDTGDLAQTIPADITSGSGTLKLTGGNTVTLSAAPSFSLWLDGTTLAPAGGALSVPASGTFTFSGSATVSGSLTLGSGSSIVCNVDAVNPGFSATLTATGGFSIPEGAGSVLALLTVSGAGAADCEASLSADGKTITVSKPGDINYVWNGGAAANWGDTDVWSNNNAAATWVDGYNAVFNTANATATLDSDVTALSLAFNVPATVCGSSVLTVPTVSVVSDVTATISAPTAGALEKIGAGTLVLSQNRTDAATTLSEGTLALSGTASLNWSNFTFGTDPAKPVTLDVGADATLASIPGTIYVGAVNGVTNTLIKQGGDWTINGNMGIGRGTGSAASFFHKGGTLTFVNYLSIGSGTDANTHADYGYLEISGGTVTNTNTGAERTIIGGYGEGTMVVTNGGSYVTKGGIVFGNSAGAHGTLTITDGGTVEVGGNISFCYKANSRATVNLKRGGVISAQRLYRGSTGTATLNFGGGTLKAVAANKNLIDSNIAVVLNANSAIDNDGKNVTIIPEMAGEAGLTLMGSGMTTISANQSYLGETIVSSGTTLSVAGITFAGGVAFEADSSLNIASYTMGTPSLTASALTLPAEGTVSLTLNGGAFARGVYAICSATGLTVADGAKFMPSTGVLSYSWSLVGDKLLLVVGDVSGNYWTGLANDGRMSTGANWYGGSVPAAGADIDFSGVGSAVTVNADSGLSYGAVTMGVGVITFTNSLTAVSFSDTSKVAVDVDSTVTVNGDLVFSGSGDEYICRSVASGGVFRVTGDIIASERKTGGYLFTCAAPSIEGIIAAKGLVNNQGAQINYGMSFVCAKGNTDANWEIGEHGLSGSSGRWFLVSSASRSAKIKATTDFANSAPIANLHNLELDTGNHTITLGNGGESRGGIMGAGTNVVSGQGKVVANYDIDNQTSNNDNKSPTFIVRGAATLALVPAAEISKTGTVTVETGGCLEVAQSGTVSLGGNLALANGAILGFNFTNRKSAPVLDCAQVPTFMDDESTNIIVKVSGVARPSAGAYVLTSCGGFNSEGVSVSLSADAPKWAKSDLLSVNADGNLVLAVKPRGTQIIVR